MRSGFDPQKLRSIRLALGLSHQALAERVGVHRRTVIDWETSRHTPLPEYQAKLARVLGVPLTALLAGEGVAS